MIPIFKPNAAWTKWAGCLRERYSEVILLSRKRMHPGSQKRRGQRILAHLIRRRGVCGLQLPRQRSKL